MKVERVRDHAGSYPTRGFLLDSCLRIYDNLKFKPTSLYELEGTMAEGLIFVRIWTDSVTLAPVTGEGPREG